MSSAYTADLQQQAYEQKLAKQKQQLFERAENLKHMASSGADGGFVREQEARLLAEAREIGMDPRDLIHGPQAERPRPPPVSTAAAPARQQQKHHDFRPRGHRGFAPAPGRG